MPETAADRNLLFGILALQLDFLGRDDLIAGMHAWVLDKGKPLGLILCERGALSAERRALLDALVREHLAGHGGDPGRSLAALGPTPSVRQGLEAIADPDVQASLAHATMPEGRPGPGATAPYLPPASLPPQARFHILRPHARGGLGEVFVARDEELGREVALKEIQRRFADDPQSRARFLLEAEVTGRLEHPGVVPVYGLGAYADGRPFYAMRLVKGDSLKDAIDRFHQDTRALPAGPRNRRLRQLLTPFVGVCNAVAYAHSRGVIHRDLKPANVMLGSFGETLVVDWGLAKVLGRGDSDSTEGPLLPTRGGDPTATRAGSALGTPAYMSPEQAAGRLDQLGPRSDVYSLGATLYCLLTGQPPFAEADPGAVLGKVRRGDFPRPRQADPRAPAALEAVCLKAMAPDPQGRYATPRDLADEVERWLADEPVAAYREPAPARASRWVRRHPAWAAGTGILLLTGLVALAVSTWLIRGALRNEEQARRERALAQVGALLGADPRAVPALLAGLGPNRPDVLPRLRELWARPEAGLSRVERGRVGLALLPVEPAPVKGRLYAWMLEADDPRELLLLRDGLRPYRDELRPDLWRRVEDPATGPAARFRALVALAAYDPGSGRWGRHAGALLDHLLTANLLYLSTWAEALRPVRAALLGPLAEAFRGKRPEHRQVAATLLADYAANRPDLLAELALEADARQYAVLLPPLKARAAAVRPLLHAELARAVPEGAADAGKDRLARRQANAAVTLLHLGEPRVVWRLLVHSADPSRRTYLTHHLGPYGAGAGALLDRLGAETDVSARRALLLSLGEYAPAQLPPGRRRALVARLVRDYRDDPDPGVHGAVEWLLRQWHEDGRLPRLRDHRPKRPPAGRPTWYANGQGQTFTLIRGPVEFRMGSPPSEPDRTANETPHRRRIPRSFAIGTKEVTVSQFRRFLKDNPALRRRFDDNGQAQAFLQKFSPDGDGPIVVVNWYMAAAYCNWLSRREGLSEAEWCYAKDPGKAKDPEAMVAVKGYLSRKGYRLPTEAEWEYACRAGAQTSRPYGRSEALLGRYAWYMANANERAHPVGQLRPNDLGLFDVLGNAAEWCQDRFGPYPTGRTGAAVVDSEDTTGKGGDNRVIRGAGFGQLALDARSASREATSPADRMNATGLRVARTCD